MVSLPLPFEFGFKMPNNQKSAFKSALDYPARQLALSLAIIAEQKKIMAVVKTALPPEIAENVQHCMCSGNRVLVYVASANWASQIRFYSVDIVNKIMAAGQQNIVGIQVRITPQHEQEYMRRTASLPSVEIINLLAQQNQGIENGDVLKSAMSRLAKTLEKRLQLK
jgi:Dna[CI] antecedent, DciA